MSKEDIDNDLDSNEEVVDEQEDSQDGQEDTQNEHAPKLSEKEATASEKGWVSKEEWEESGKDPEDWVDAGEFLAREKLYKSLHAVKRENKQLNKALSEVTRMVKGIADKTRKETMAELQEKFKAAAENRDIEAALEIKDEIQELAKEDKEDTKTDQLKSADIFTEWHEENKWFDQDKNEELYDYANGVASRLYNKVMKEKPQGEVLSEDEIRDIYDQVTKKTKERFPEKFNNPNRQKRTVVNDSSKRSVNNLPSKKVLTFKDLPDDDARAVAKQLLRRGEFKNEAEYMKFYQEAHSGQTAN